MIYILYTFTAEMKYCCTIFLYFTNAPSSSLLCFLCTHTLKIILQLRGTNDCCSQLFTVGELKRRLKKIKNSLWEYLECNVFVRNTQRDICKAFSIRGFGHIHDRAWCRLMTTIQKLKFLQKSERRSRSMHIINRGA